MASTDQRGDALKHMPTTHPQWNLAGPDGIWWNLAGPGEIWWDLAGPGGI
jgi:hypothetical protein